MVFVVLIGIMTFMPEGTETEMEFQMWENAWSWMISEGGVKVITRTCAAHIRDEHISAADA